jgi:formyl-CoA transferase
MSSANDPASAQAGPLSDIRVVEMGQLLAGPFCGQLMADFGAEVIKVEQPGAGDPMREWGREKPHGQSLWWPVIARNKKSIEINARDPAGQDIIRDLVRRSDVLIENFRPGTMEKWGLGYEALSAINPRLVMIRVSGYGQTGPYSKNAGYGAIGEAMGGLRYVVGDPSNPPSRTWHLHRRHACRHLRLPRRHDGPACTRQDGPRAGRRQRHLRGGPRGDGEPRHGI